VENEHRQECLRYTKCELLAEFVDDLAEHAQPEFGVFGGEVVAAHEAAEFFFGAGWGPRRERAAGV
jgi:hypothetical protein